MKKAAALFLLVCFFASTLQAARAKSEITIEISKFSYFSAIGALPENTDFGGMDIKTTKGTALHILVGCMDYSQRYRIQSIGSFWKRLWLSVVNMVRIIRIDFSSKPDYKDLKNIGDAQLWGVFPNEENLDGNLCGRELLKWESRMLSEMLARNGVPRTLTEEIDYLRKQVEWVDSEALKRFKSLGLDIKGSLLDENWLYYIFAVNHSLLPAWVQKASDLDTDLTLSQTLDFLWKAIGYCKQMAHDLEQ